MIDDGHDALNSTYIYRHHRPHPAPERAGASRRKGCDPAPPDVAVTSSMPTRAPAPKKKARQQQRRHGGRQRKGGLIGKKAPSVGALLEAAAASMASLDVEAAYHAYKQASSLLRARQPSSRLPEGPGGSGTAAAGELNLIHVLERMGECQVSMGEPDLARGHFAEALQLLERQGKLDSATEEALPSSPPPSSFNFLETHSSLCLYIGQLSLGREALEACLRGVAGLERCIQQMEHAAETPPGTGEHLQQQQHQAQQEGDAILGGPTTSQSARDKLKKEDSESDDIDADMSLPQTSQRQPQQDQPPPQTPTLLLQDLRQKLSKAYCNVAELYLTDLCEEETAERDCQHYLEKALQLKDADGEPLVDALQTMASLRLSQPPERQLEAVPFILSAYEKQRVGSEALAALVGLNHDYDGNGNAEGDDETMKAEEDQPRELLQVEAANNLPEFEFRCQTAKLLLECAALLKERRKDGDSNVAAACGTAPATSSQAEECIAAAISVLGSLLAQNDEVVEIWYLTGCAFAAKSPPLVDTARFYLDRAKDMLTEIRKSLQNEAQFAGDTAEQNEVEEQLEMNATQMQDVEAKLGELQDSDIGEDEELATMEE